MHISSENLYCNSLTTFSRYTTRIVNIGNVPLGGQHPIRIQSMTTTDTMNTIATVEQSIRMIEAGCEYVRITAPSVKEAKNLENIKKELRRRGYTAPLIADIHFTPNAAELAARIVEKIRVNPGNYVDKKKFETLDFSDSSYEAELERIRARFTPLIKICKEYGTAMRIGTNHGSLSDRIMSRYGDTPMGMVESAMEFLRICEDNNYHEIVLSMKASNPQVMVQAYRLLIKKMKEEEMNYPLHLGVTEAGEGEDGRIKSAVGIGTLLEDGIGDTIRVSLTEDPEFEIPVAMALTGRYRSRVEHKKIEEISIKYQVSGIKTPEHSTRYRVSSIKTLDSKLPYNPYQYNRRQSVEALNIGGSNVPCVIADFSGYEKINAESFIGVGYNYSASLDKWHLSDQACDFIYLGNNVDLNFQIPGTLGLIYNYDSWNELKNKTRCYPLFTALEFFSSTVEKSEILNFVKVDIDTLINPKSLILNPDFISSLKTDTTIVIVFETSNAHGMAEQRRMFIELLYNDCQVPVIIKRDYSFLKEDDLQLHASTDFGALFLEGFGDGIWISSRDISFTGRNEKEFNLYQTNSGFQNLKTAPSGINRKYVSFPSGNSTTFGILKSINSTAFGILQATRTRISKTEYISCPSCGRTLFDLQETTAKIRKRTDHLKGIKIGIMGCIVNGPGEMADADYGYVGTGIGKITLYKGKEVVRRNIDSENAVDELIDLIKEHGDWTSPRLSPKERGQ